jgi:2-polyprenyl-3-methyl-5-hydroxy-6-metoxy-1,4-benzoquinol methylase
MRDELEMREDYHARVRPDVLELVPDRADKVLDVGGGIGANVAHLKRMGKARFGAVADLVAHQCLPDVDAAFAGDLEQPDVWRRAGSEAGPFDAILCLDVLEHLKDPWSTVRECHKLLKPNGVIVASIPNARNYRFVLPLPLKGRLDYTDEGILDRTHLRWFVRSTAVDLMTCSGLALEDVQGRYYARKKDILNSATFGVFDDLLFLQYFIRVRRTD